MPTDDERGARYANPAGESGEIVNLFPQDGEAAATAAPTEMAAETPHAARDAGGDAPVEDQPAPAHDATDARDASNMPATAEEPSGARLVIVGVGGAGCNIINHMVESALRGVEFVALNTDTQALGRSLAQRKLAIGRDVTRGMGAGGNPSVGQQAAQESYHELVSALTGADMVFIVAGMGGGTGTGASPIVAQAAREVGALTLAIVTTPFAFERRRRTLAEQGVAALRSVVDAIIIAPNERLAQLVGRDTSVFEAYRLADETLRAGVQGLSDLITNPGFINLDFADVRAVMRDAGSAYLASGSATGEDRAESALRNALSNPLLDVDIAGARGLLFNVTGGDDLTMREVEQVADALSVTAHPDANLIFGATYDAHSDGALRLTIVATGFEPHVASGARASAWSPPHIALEPGRRDQRPAGAGAPSLAPGRMSFDEPLPQLSQPPGGAGHGWSAPPWASQPYPPLAPPPDTSVRPQPTPPNRSPAQPAQGEPTIQRGRGAAPNEPAGSDQRVSPAYPREEYAENPDEHGANHGEDDDRHGFWSRLFSSNPPNPPSSVEP